MRLAVMGAGRLGVYFGDRLCRDGADVHFIACGAHLQAMKAEGSDPFHIARVEARMIRVTSAASMS